LILLEKILDIRDFLSSLFFLRTGRFLVQGSFIAPYFAPLRACSNLRFPLPFPAD
jgi:hypothetical protein